MRQTRLRRWLILVGLIGALALGGLGLIAWALPESRESRRLDAQRRWEARPFSSYRISVEMQRFNTTCVEELEVRGQQLNVLRDTCTISWLPHLTVPALFELGRRLERSPECFPSGGCVCERVRSGSVLYDQQLGFPQQIAIRRSYRPTWYSLGYWRQAWQRLELPSCSSQLGGLSVRVVELTPLD